MNHLEHRHLDDEQIEAVAFATLDDFEEPETTVECQECETRISAHVRYLSLARLMARDTRAPLGTPAVDAVRMIRRQSYPRRALGEIAALLTSSPMKARV